MNMFTQGQKTRMIAAINQSRQNLLNHTLCGSSTTFIDEVNTTERTLIKIVDVLGKEVTNSLQFNKALFYIFDDGSVEKKLIIK